MKLNMAEEPEKRGPIQKGEKGWPINPIGVVALVVFGLIIIFLIVKPLLQKQTPSVDIQQNTKGGQIISPQAGEIIRSNNLTIEFSADTPQNVSKIQFWAKSYVDGKWEIIGEATSAPYKLDWQIPDNFKNKAIALTTHIFTTDNQEIKDPGGWREGIIIISN